MCPVLRALRAMDYKQSAPELPERPPLHLFEYTFVGMICLEWYHMGIDLKGNKQIKLTLDDTDYRLYQCLKHIDKAVAD